MKILNSKLCIMSLLVGIIIFSSTQLPQADAEMWEKVNKKSGIKMFTCANNPLGNLYDKPGVTAGQIMAACKEKTDGYSWNSRIYTLIYAPGFNSDPNSLDTIGKDKEFPITAASNRGGSMSLASRSNCNGFIETGRDHGLFYGSIKLSGFRYDITGDGVVDSFGGNRCESPSTRATGTLDDGSGRVETKQDGSISITWNYAENKFISKNIKYSWREAIVKLDQNEYTVGETATATIIDLDNVRFPFDNKFGIPVRVYSDTDKAGIDLLAYWNANYKGIVQMNADYPVKIKLTDTNLSESSDVPIGKSYGELRVSTGDTIYVEYIDRTLPRPDMIGDEKKIIATAKIVKIKNQSNIEEESSKDSSISDERKIEFKKYTSDGKYLITLSWDNQTISVGKNTINISIVDGVTQKQVFNVPYSIQTSQNDQIFTFKYNGKPLKTEIDFNRNGITELMIRDVGGANRSVDFKFDVV